MTVSSPFPPLSALLGELRTRTAFDFAQVRISADPVGFELRHVADAERPVDELRTLALAELRAWAQTTRSGEFRPIKTAPNLRTGWRCRLAAPEELTLALDALYPGALADWWVAGCSGPLPVQNYREFTARQSGMYRITQQLTDAGAAAVIRAGCDAQFCLRRRLWTVEGLPPDGDDAGKSVIPCLEICPLMLEFARQSRRLEQAEPVDVQLAPGELATVIGALDLALAEPPKGREGDLAQPGNPRRIRLLRDRLQGLLPSRSPAATDD